jgi:hypothetical protein
MLNAVETSGRVLTAAYMRLPMRLGQTSLATPVRGGVHVREAGEEAGVHREGQGLRVGHTVLGEDVAHVLGLVHRDGAGRAIAGDVHAKEFGEVAPTLNFESCTKLSLERCKPSGIIASCMNIVHVKFGHGEDVTGVEDVDAWAGDALLPPCV